MKSGSSQANAIWGAGWACGAVLLPLAMVMANDSGSGGILSPYCAFLVTISISVAAVGVPVYISGRRVGWRHAGLVACIWVLGAGIGARLFSCFPRFGAPVGRSLV